MYFPTTALSLWLFLTSGLSVVRGQGNESSNARIISGVDTVSPQTFLVSIQRLWGSTQAAHICGGVIVDTDLVLTAASCLHPLDPSELKVLAGVNDLRSTMGSSHAVVEYEVNGKRTRGNNLAVLKVSPSFTLSSRISMKKISADSVVQEGDVVYLYGWGRVDPSGFLPTFESQMLVTKVISNKHCQRFYTNLDPNALCTYISPGKGICKGDAGGPVIARDTNELVGIISNGLSTCGTGYPDVSTLVKANAKFITQAKATLSTSTGETATKRTNAI